MGRDGLILLVFLIHIRRFHVDETADVYQVAAEHLPHRSVSMAEWTAEVPCRELSAYSDRDW